MKKKITFYCDSMDKGGTEKATLDLVNNLSSDKYDITIVQLSKGGYYQQFLKDGIKIKEIIPVSPEKSFKWYWRLRNLYNKIPARINHKLFIGDNQDIEVACGYGYPNVIVSKSKKAKKILWVHMDVSLDKNRVSLLTKEQGQEYFKNIDRIICVSYECEEKFNEKFDLKEKTETIYNIVPTKTIRELANKETNISFSKRDFNIVSIGRLTWQKGYDLLIDEIEILIKKEKSIHLFIIGEGEEYNSLLNKIRMKGLDDYISLLGYVDNPYPLIKKADLYVCSSRHESFGLTIAESMVLGTPVLSTKCTGPNEILKEDYYGKQVDNQKGSIASGIADLIKNKNILSEYSDRGYNRIDIFDKQKIIKSWEKVVDSN